MKKTRFIILSIFLCFFILLPVQAKEISFSYFIDDNNTLTAKEAADKFSESDKLNTLDANNTIRTSLGFTKGTFWCQVAESAQSELPPPRTIQIISFGAEAVDSIEVFYKSPDDNKYNLYDSTGFAIRNKKKSLVSWRMAIPLSSEAFPDGKYLLKIQNSDSTNLTIKFYSPNYFFFQTVIFTIIHSLFILLMLMAGIFLLIQFLIHRDKSLQYLCAMTLSFLLYQLARKGFGPVYIWNFASSLLLFKRIGYLAATSGYLFAMTMIIRSLNGKGFPFYNLVPKALLLISLICLFLYIFMPDIFVPYVTSLIFLLLGNLYIVALCSYLFLKKNTLHATLIFAWMPLFAYVVFRQTIHLLRIWIDLSKIMIIFDNDYYFGYDICFLINIVLSSLFILNNLKNEHKIKNYSEIKNNNKGNIKIRSNHNFKNSSIIIAENDTDLLDKMKPLFSSFTYKKFVKNGLEALKHMNDFKPDLIIAEASMPKMNAIALYYECKKRDDLKHIPFIIITESENLSLITSFENDGLFDFILKPFDFYELLHKVEFILSLSRACRKDYAEKINRFMQNSLQSPSKENESIPQNYKASIMDSRMKLYTKYRLSQREIEIAELLFDNHTNKEIADMLFVSVSTIATHIKHIYEKFKVSNRNEWLKVLMNN